MRQHLIVFHGNFKPQTPDSKSISLLAHWANEVGLIFKFRLTIKSEHITLFYLEIRHLQTIILKFEVF